MELEALKGYDIAEMVTFNKMGSKIPYINGYKLEAFLIEKRRNKHLAFDQGTPAGQYDKGQQDILNELIEIVQSLCVEKKDST